jgi:hypothetical protein
MEREEIKHISEQYDEPTLLDAQDFQDVLEAVWPDVVTGHVKSPIGCFCLSFSGWCTSPAVL